MRRRYAWPLMIGSAIVVAGGITADRVTRPEKPIELTEIRQIEKMFRGISRDLSEALPENFVVEMERYHDLRLSDAVRDYAENNKINLWYVTIGYGFILPFLIGLAGVTPRARDEPYSKR